MRKLYFLVPGTGGKFACGGLWAELKTLNLVKQVCIADVVPYNVVYHAHSAGYRFKLPASIPIVTVSRNTLGYWGQHSPNSLIYYLPNQISDEFRNLNQERDIDVLVQARKSSEYLIQELIPALQQRCNVVVVDSYVDDLAGLFNRAKVYLYDSAEYWGQQRVSEGFGLQPLEALACGCQVFSSVNGGLSDYLDPGFNCLKIAGYSKEYDVQRILKVLNAEAPLIPEHFLEEYRAENITKRFKVILDDINDFFDHKKHHSPNIKSLTRMRRTQLLMQRIFGKLKRKYLQAQR